MDPAALTAENILIEIKTALQSVTTNEGDLVNIIAAYRDLYAATNANRLKTKQIFDYLVKFCLQRENPLKNVERELRFEAHVMATGERKRSAGNNLKYGTFDVDDEDLDLYNERISRNFDE